MSSLKGSHRVPRRLPRGREAGQPRRRGLRACTDSPAAPALTDPLHLRGSDHWSPTRDALRFLNPSNHGLLQPCFAPRALIFCTRIALAGGFRNDPPSETIFPQPAGGWVLCAGRQERLPKALCRLLDLEASRGAFRSMWWDFVRKLQAVLGTKVEEPP